METIDNESISRHSAELSIYNGQSFNTRMLFMAALFGVAGVAMLFSADDENAAGFIIGPALLFGATFVLTSSHGVDISFSTDYAREYHKRFFVKTGKWIPMSPYADICILKLGRTRRTSDLTGMVSTDLDASKNEVYLMTHDHRKRFLLKVCNSQKEAVSFAGEMAEKLDKKLTVYNPKLTEKTRQRMRYRR